MNIGSMKKTYAILFLSLLTPFAYGDFEVISGTCEQQYLNMIWGESDDGTFNIYINGEENPTEVDFILIATGGIRSASSR